MESQNATSQVYGVKWARKRRHPPGCRLEGDEECPRQVKSTGANRGTAPVHWLESPSGARQQDQSVCGSPPDTRNGPCRIGGTRRKKFLPIIRNRKPAGIP